MGDLRKHGDTPGDTPGIGRGGPRRSLCPQSTCASWRRTGAAPRLPAGAASRRRTSAAELRVVFRARRPPQARAELRRAQRHGAQAQRQRDAMRRRRLRSPLPRLTADLQDGRDRSRETARGSETQAELVYMRGIARRQQGARSHARACSPYSPQSVQRSHQRD